MAKRNNSVKERPCVTLSKQEAERFNAYIIELSKKKGRVPAGVRAKIMRMALTEWLDKHERDFEVNLAEH